MTDYGPPIPIGNGPGGVLKVKRGGTGSVGNSGNARPRFYTPNACVRAAKGGNKSKSHHGGKVLPRPPRAPVVWDPRDPFIIEFQKARATGVIGDFHFGIPHASLQALLAGRKMALGGGDAVRE